MEGIRVTAQPIFEEVAVSGSLSPFQQSRISAEVSGYVAAVHVDAGHEIRQGQSLADLDRELNQIDLQVAEAQVQRARAALGKSRRRLAEVDALIEKSYIAETQVKDLAAQVDIDQATLRAAEAEVARQQALLTRRRIEAPFNGIVARKLTEVGQWVDPGDELFELITPQRYFADLQVPQRYFSRIQAGDAIQLQLSDLERSRSVATVEQKVPLARDQGRTFLLRARIEKDGDQATIRRALIPGMSVSAKLRLATGRSGIAVPRDALIRYPDGRVTVWVTGGGSAYGAPLPVTEVIVSPGISFSGQVEIRSGLTEQAMVIVTGNEALSEGLQVIVRKPE
ncbi:efflux RND transporter periplasmic adaptor subunit [Biformimicrobium ophioploci]|uniref:Efflux RND transporter periplasmic adaptor subunit n=1 Tax=Biformimicrobium ophioploci TaxID=3036711 RepID=A0ABQ6LZ60_9GAMM|nr:efflux RND transporter periplasmic adaptor subunit [Microbulbifer sp. NKW57]GMG87322.1 efflux RND transporter periplasmic adaptor subunit [Microbulbifer sp. NKW57]